MSEDTSADAAAHGFEFLPQSSGRYVAVKVTGRLTDDDYKAFVPQIEELIRAHGSLRLYVDLTGFEGFTAKAAWDDFTFGLKHRRDFERMALVGDAAWEELAARTAGLLMDCDVRHFASADHQIAWDFILDID